MDVFFDFNGVRFVWDASKAQRNIARHGISFAGAAHAFFDPFLRVVNAARSDDARDAVIGLDLQSRLLFVVHVQINEETIRIISARKATSQEREHYDS